RQLRNPRQTRECDRPLVELDDLVRSGEKTDGPIRGDRTRARPSHIPARDARRLVRLPTTARAERHRRAQGRIVSRYLYELRAHRPRQGGGADTRSVGGSRRTEYSKRERARTALTGDDPNR